MKVDAFRRVLAGLFVILMGVVAALPYHRTPPPLKAATLPEDGFEGSEDSETFAAFEAPPITPTSNAAIQSSQSQALPAARSLPATQDAVPQPSLGTNFATGTGTHVIPAPMVSRAYQSALPASLPRPAASSNAAPDEGEQLDSRIGSRTGSRTGSRPGSQHLPPTLVTNSDDPMVALPGMTDSHDLRQVSRQSPSSLVLDPVQPANPILDSRMDSRTDRSMPQSPTLYRQPGPVGMTTPESPPMAAQFPSSQGAVSIGNELTGPPREPFGSRGRRAVARTPSGVSRPDSPPPLRTYVIRDGDTLRGIAERLLGDAGRADEIYQMNLRMLPSPELLPLGVSISIPPRVKPQPQANGMVPVYIPS